MKKLSLFILLIIFPFMVIALPVGDVDGDGYVKSNDYILVRKHILKNPVLTGDKLTRANVDGKNGVNSADYIAIRKIIMGGGSPATPTPAPKEYTISFDANGGSVEPKSIVVKENNVFGTLPIPKKDGFKFVGWFTSEGKDVSENSKATSNITIYAHWEDTCNINLNSIKVFSKTNEAMNEYLANPTEKNKAQTVYNKYNCGKEACYVPNEYKTELTGKINVYKYDLNTKKKELITTVSSGDINYFLIPNRTYYLESTSDRCKVEIVKVTGTLRQVAVPGVGNFRDLGGWKASGGTVKYGKIYRSANTNVLSTATPLNYLGITSVVDLRPNSEISHTSAVESIRIMKPITYYSTGQNVRDATEEIMKAIVNDKGVLFNCNFGRDRTGTMAYIIEGLLGVSLTDRETDFELTYFFSTKRNRNDSSFKSLINGINKYSQTTNEEEKFINWYLSSSSNKSADLELINNFRNKMIDGNPQKYKLSDNKVVLS